jgi:hypothetical protein
MNQPFTLMIGNSQTGVAMKTKLTRMESSKEVRRVLNRNGVNLSYCNYSCAGKEIRLTGWLCKYDESDYNGGQIEGLMQDFERYLPGFTVVGELENWSFSSDQIRYTGTNLEILGEQEEEDEDAEAG